MGVTPEMVWRCGMAGEDIRMPFYGAFAALRVIDDGLPEAERTIPRALTGEAFLSAQLALVRAAVADNLRRKAPQDRQCTQALRAMENAYAAELDHLRWLGGG